MINIKLIDTDTNQAQDINLEAITIQEFLDKYLEKLEPIKGIQRGRHIFLSENNIYRPYKNTELLKDNMRFICVPNIMWDGPVLTKCGNLCCGDFNKKGGWLSVSRML